MYSKSSFNYLYKSINTSILNKNILIIVILLLSSIFICHLCINESFTVSKTISLDTYYFRTEKQKKDGLMHIKKPLCNKGALFVYPLPQKICIWMKNTFIPLDAIILNKDFKIMEFILDLKPEDLTTKCTKTQNGSYFIEVDSGFINDKNLNVGDSIVCNEIPFNLDI
jgi:uncharacterized membrane protein (UPF0127 family)